jgi:hypothetical protein
MVKSPMPLLIATEFFLPIKRVLEDFGKTW